MYIVQLYKEDWGILHMLGCRAIALPGTEQIVHTMQISYQMMIGRAVLQIVNSLHLYMNMQYIKKQVNPTVVNINTQTHDPHLDDTEQIHEQQSADDILNVEGNKDVIIENNTNDDEETNNDLQEEQAVMIVSNN